MGAEDSGMQGETSEVYSDSAAVKLAELMAAEPVLVLHVIQHLLANVAI